MNRFPDTMEDWDYYVGSLSEDQIVSKAYAANTMGFVRQMLEEGYTPQEVERILTLFAERLEALGKMVPDGGAGFYTSYLELLNSGSKADE